MRWIRWIVVPVAVFLGALVLFAAMPRSSLIRMLDLAEHSLDSVTTLVRPAADRTGDRAVRAVGAAGEASRAAASGRAGGSWIRKDPHQHQTRRAVVLLRGRSAGGGLETSEAVIPEGPTETLTGWIPRSWRQPQLVLRSNRAWANPL